MSRVKSAKVDSSGTLEQGGTEPASRNWVPRAGRWGQRNSFSCFARFAVNFTVGQGPGADVAFHFNPRFDGWDKVVFNTKQDGKWGGEERKRSMPFRKGASFELVFMVLAEHYKVGGGAGRGRGRSRGGGGAEGGDPPVHADRAQVEDGGGAQHDVHGHERVAEAGAQQPHTAVDLGREEGAVQHHQPDPLTARPLPGLRPSAPRPGCLWLGLRKAWGQTGDPDL